MVYNNYQIGRQETDMILKVGYYGKDGIECYRYIDEFSDVIVADIQAGYRYDTKDAKLTLNGKELDHPEFVQFTSLENHEPQIVNVVYIVYYTETGAMTTIAALGGTVYILNDNGKTVDRY